MTQLEAFYVMDDLRLCIMEALKHTTNEELKDSCVKWGSLTWDDCCPGMVRVGLVRQYASSLFPDPTLRPDPCNIFTRATDIRALILRCEPTINADAEFPTCDALTRGAMIGAQDADALWRAAQCCFGKVDSMFPYVVRDVSPTPSRGGCVGTQMTITVELGGTCECG